jgi:hypothetical protein
VIWRHTARIRQVLPIKNKAAVPRQATEAVPANTPGRDVPNLEPDSLLARLVELARAAEQAGPDGLVLDSLRSQREAMEESWRAYTAVVDVLNAITHSARLVEMGVCVASQLAALELLNDELEIVWERWDNAHQKVIGRQARRLEP